MEKRANPKYVAESGGWSWSMLNPLGPWLSNNTDKFHDFFANLSKNNPRIGWLAERSVDAALLGVALTAAARGAKWLYDLGNSGGPAKGIRNQVGTTFVYGGDEDKKKKRRGDKEDAGSRKVAAVVPRPGATDVADTAVNVLIPSVSLLLASMATYAGIDRMADKARTKVVKRTLAEDNKALKSLFEARARLANGNATDEEIDKVLQATKDFGYVKTAGEEGNKSLLQRATEAVGNLFKSTGDTLATDVGPARQVSNFATAITLLTIASGGATAIGAYNFYKKRNANNIKFNAYKKGLEEYARLKAEMSPLTMVADQGMIDRINTPGPAKAGKPAKEEPRTLPEAQASHRPMMLTLD